MQLIYINIKLVKFFLQKDNQLLDMTSKVQVSSSRKTGKANKLTDVLVMVQLYLMNKRLVVYAFCFFQ